MFLKLHLRHNLQVATIKIPTTLNIPHVMPNWYLTNYPTSHHWFFVQIKSQTHPLLVSFCSFHNEISVTRYGDLLDFGQI